jgi:hypothetical protein
VSRTHGPSSDTGAIALQCSGAPSAKVKRLRPSMAACGRLPTQSAASE